MTTKNNHLTLIEQIGGIEKARGIVEGAPSWANGYNTVIHQYTRGVWFSRDFRLSDLRTAIAEHDQTSVLPTLDQEFERGDLIVYHSIESHKNLFSVRYVGGDSITVYECLDEMGAKTFSENKPYSDIRHATPEEIKAGHLIDKQLESDDCTDIRNHLSPSTRVVDL